jgi:hypothetical protein
MEVQPEDAGFQFLSERKEHSINMRIGDNLLRWLDSQAQDGGTTRSALIIRALVEYACRVDGMRVAGLNSDMQDLIENMANNLELVPGKDGKFRLQMVDAEVIRLDGEEVIVAQGA